MDGVATIIAMGEVEPLTTGDSLPQARPEAAIPLHRGVAVVARVTVEGTVVTTTLRTLPLLRPPEAQNPPQSP